MNGATPISILENSKRLPVIPGLSLSKGALALLFWDTVLNLPQAKATLIKDVVKITTCIVGCGFSAELAQGTESMDNCLTFFCSLGNPEES